ncbi:hypothetical protein HDV01_007840 [Terramyces sp. JEL0728]|nr:hypothetical protein HDV01_007840 [Terramyces sp. JEL0728]
MVFEGSLYGDGVQNQNEFLYKWGMFGAAAILETAIFGLVVAIVLFRGISQAFEKTLSKNLARQIRVYLLGFIAVTILLDLSYQSSGFLKVYNLESLSLSFLSIGTSISGFQLVYFTFIFKKTLEFLDTVSSNSRNDEKRQTLPKSIEASSEPHTDKSHTT